MVLVRVTGRMRCRRGSTVSIRGTRGRHYPHDLVIKAKAEAAAVRDGAFSKAGAPNGPEPGAGMACCS